MEPSLDDSTPTNLLTTNRFTIHIMGTSTFPWQSLEESVALPCADTKSPIHIMSYRTMFGEVSSPPIFLKQISSPPSPPRKSQRVSDGWGWVGGRGWGIGDISCRPQYLISQHQAALTVSHLLLIPGSLHLNNTSLTGMHAHTQTLTCILTCPHKYTYILMRDTQAHSHSQANAHMHSHVHKQTHRYTQVHTHLHNTQREHTHSHTRAWTQHLSAHFFFFLAQHI